MIALAGCTEVVVVATECRPEDAQCLVPSDGSPAEVGSMDAAVGLDGTAPNLDAAAPALDAFDAGSLEVDAFIPAPTDAAVWLLPALKNPSFELTDGQPGDVATVSLPTATVIAPWFSCQPIGGGQGALTGVRAEAAVPLLEDGPNPELVLARDGRTFVAMQYFVTLLPPVLVQQLGAPLGANEHYGFAIDVRSSNTDGHLSLKVYGSDSGCENTLEATELASTDPITMSGWQTVCLRFTTPRELPYLMLVESSATPVSGDRLFFDHLRSVEACPR
jgi:hypothetical protein